MFTNIEGEWDEIMPVIRACIDKVAEAALRVTVTIKLDWVPGSPPAPGATSVTRLVAPGPSVASATPARPVSRPMTSAISAPPCSCRTGTNRMPDRSSDSDCGGDTARPAGTAEREHLAARGPVGQDLFRAAVGHLRP